MFSRPAQSRGFYSRSNRVSSDCLHARCTLIGQFRSFFDVYSIDCACTHVYYSSTYCRVLLPSPPTSSIVTLSSNTAAAASFARIPYLIVLARQTTHIRIYVQERRRLSSTDADRRRLSVAGGRCRRRKKNRPLCSDDVVHVERLRTTTIALSSIATNASCMCVCVCVWCRDHSTTDTLYSIYRQSVTLAVTQNPEDRRPTTRIGSDRLLWKLFVPIDLKRLPV